ADEELGPLLAAEARDLGVERAHPRLERRLGGEVVLEGVDRALGRGAWLADVRERPGRLARGGDRTAVARRGLWDRRWRRGLLPVRRLLPVDDVRRPAERGEALLWRQ